MLASGDAFQIEGVYLGGSIKASRPDGSFAVGYLGSNAIGQLNVSPTYSGSDIKGSRGVYSFAQTYKGSNIEGSGDGGNFSLIYLDYGDGASGDAFHLECVYLDNSVTIVFGAATTELRCDRHVPDFRGIY